MTKIEGDPLQNDKSVENINDVRKSQLTELVEIPTEISEVVEEKLEESEILAR